ncbi:MAG: TetR/AcrR family transcriptional regulator [Candidatus Marinimicrobia bacterium]|nr:TetR/AcrR family transcriptional regulator [Candidatus Neomarinimicrobiota bacterium]
MTPLPKDKAKRKRIIAAAIQVFAHDGLSNGKIATIAEKAGIGKGTVYEYFSSKEEIFAAVFKDFFDQMLAGYTQLIDAPMDPVKKIELVFDYSYDYLDQLLEDEHGQDWLIFLEIFLQGFRDEFKGIGKLSFSAVLREMYDIFKPIVEEGIQAGMFRQLDPDYVTFILFTSLDGLSIHYFLNRDHYDTNKLKDITKEIFLNGLLQPSQKEGS